MVWLPTLRVEMLKVATPPLSVPVPIVVAPSRKFTVPVGVPVPGATGATVAVNVTDWLKTEGFVDEVTAVVVLALTIRGAEAWLPVPPLVEVTFPVVLV